MLNKIIEIIQKEIENNISFEKLEIRHRIINENKVIKTDFKLIFIAGYITNNPITTPLTNKQSTKYVKYSIKINFEIENNKTVITIEKKVNSNTKFINLFLLNDLF